MPVRKATAHPGALSEVPRRVRHEPLALSVAHRTDAALRIVRDEASARQRVAFARWEDRGLSVEEGPAMIGIAQGLAIGLWLAVRR